MFWCVSYNFGALGTVWLSYKTRWKTVVMVQKFVPRSRIGIFRNERTRSSTLDSKLLFSCILHYLGAFGIIWSPYKTRFRTGRSVQKFTPRSCIAIFRNESTRSDPLDPKLTFWCVSYYLGAFGTLWLPYNTQCKTGQTGAKLHATKTRWNFSNEHPRSTPLDPKKYFGAFHKILVHLGPFS